MTDLEAIAKAQKELDISTYYEETSSYAGMRAMHRNRAEWLFRVLTLARKAIYIEENQKKQKTNADRIRAMSDEELAGFLDTWGCCHHCIEHERLSDNRWFSDERCDEKCVEHCLEWLKQPAEVDNG